MDAGSIYVRLGLQDQKFQSGMGRATGAIGKFAGALGVGAGIAAVTQFAKKIIELQSQFSFTMSRVKALTGATIAQNKAMTDLARQLGSETQYTAQQAGDAMGFLAMAGLKTNQILTALPGTLELAAAGNIQLAEAADIATNVMSAYDLKAKDLGKVNDVIANTVTNANTNVLEFAEAFKMVGPIAKSAGMEIADVSGHIGILANSGIKGTMAGTQLRAMLAKLLNPTGDAKKKLDELNITVLDGQGKMRKLNDIMQDLHDAGASTSDMFEIFDNRAAAAATVLASGAGTFEDFAKIIERTGTASKIADEQMDNLRGDLLKMKSAWEDLILTIGKTGDSSLRGGVSDLTKIINQMSYAIESVSVAMDNPPWSWLKEGPVERSVWDWFGIVEPTKDLLEFLGIIDGAPQKFEKFIPYLQTPMDFSPQAKFDPTFGMGKFFKKPEEVAPQVNVKPQTTVSKPTVSGGQLSSAMSLLESTEEEIPVWLEDVSLWDGWIEKQTEASDITKQLEEDQRSLLENAIIPGQDEIHKMAAGYAELGRALMDSVVSSGAGLKEFAGMLRQTVKQVIAARIAMAVSTMVGTAMADTAMSGPFAFLLAPLAGAAAAALANTAFDALIPSFDTGISNVPQDMLAKIHKEEAVLNPVEARQWRSGKSSVKVEVVGGRFDGRDFVLGIREVENMLSNV